MSAAALRRVASPYARRLAQEHGVQLAAIAGSGPGGRVVAADIFAARLVNASTPPVASRQEPAAAHPSLSVIPTVLDATADVCRLNDLLAAISDAGSRVTREDAILRAAALALAGHSANGLEAKDTISLETDAGGTILVDAKTRTVSAIRVMRENAIPNRSPSADLSIRFNSRPGIRCLLMPLLPGVPLRLSVSFSRNGGHVDLTLVHDADAVPSDRAEEILANLCDRLTEPLTLFV